MEVNSKTSRTTKKEPKQFMRDSFVTYKGILGIPTTRKIFVCTQKRVETHMHAMGARKVCAHIKTCAHTRTRTCTRTHTRSKCHADKASVLTPPRLNQICSRWQQPVNKLIIYSGLLLSKNNTTQVDNACSGNSWKSSLFTFLCMTQKASCAHNITGLTVSFLPLPLLGGD